MVNRVSTVDSLRVGVWLGEQSIADDDALELRNPILNHNVADCAGGQIVWSDGYTARDEGASESPQQTGRGRADNVIKSARVRSEAAGLGLVEGGQVTAHAHDHLSPVGGEAHVFIWASGRTHIHDSRIEHAIERLV
jgi:hypothetical protein